ncbi:hypothetical protein [Pleomorphomonas sp. NRK KF1]|uniref:hypothetical protein n=1 Tax=Pleomorphomonas sp. NRK KF1 TaxID=2943000 RepID=UPI002042FBBB|nr:hypothetical protein [Pleomorphomonas sp. NRK KF1]MCM5555495.1 hypothetical protein [Pleomorphomonas sp. NRK KF1]
MIDTGLRWFAATLCIAGLTHIAAILLAPSHSRDMAFTGVDFSKTDGTLVLVDNRNTSADLDPAFLNAVCRFDDETGPVRLTGTMPGRYWSVAAMSEDGRILSTLSREDLRGTDMDLLVGRTATLDAVRQSAGLESIETMSLPVDRGFLLLRLFAGSLDDRGRAEEALKDLRCRPALSE